MISHFMIGDRGANDGRCDPPQGAPRSHGILPTGSLRLKVYVGFDSVSVLLETLDVEESTRGRGSHNEVRNRVLRVCEWTPWNPSAPHEALLDQVCDWGLSGQGPGPGRQPAPAPLPLQATSASIWLIADVAPSTMPIASTCSSASADS